MTDNNADVSTKSAAYAAMWDRWFQSRTLDAGTTGMRLAGEEFLPRFKAENITAWEKRLKRSFLVNFYTFAINNLNGKMFSRPVVLENSSPEYTEWSEDIDLLGNDISQFAKKYAREVMVGGLAHILVDFPRSEGQKTIAQEQSEGLRPYFRLISPEDLIFARCIIENGKEKVIHARIWEPTVVSDGRWGEKQVNRIRVLDPGQGEIWEEVEEGQWELVIGPFPMLDGQGNLLAEVPLKTTYTMRQAFMVSALLLQDLGDLNVRHWQSHSDQINILTFTRFPVAWGTGLTDTEADASILAPNSFLTSSNSQAKFGLLEGQGTAVDLGFKDLQRLEEKMARMAMDPLVKSPGNQTATGRALDSKEANSPLQALALSIEDTINNAYECMELWTGKDAPSVKVNTDFGISIDRVSDIDALLKMHFAGAITKESLYKELIRRGVLAEDFDIQTELNNILDEFPMVEEGELLNDSPVEGGLDPQGGSRPAV